jgi:ZIP family zinc transporter
MSPAGALEAAFWGGVAGAPLVIGAALGLRFGRSQRFVSATMALGAGVLIASVAFELMEDAFQAGGVAASATGLVAGSIAFSVADWAVNRSGGKHRKRSRGQQAGNAARGIVVGALMDGVPESVAIGVGLFQGGRVSWTMVAAVFLSNLPESLSAAAGLRKAGKSRAWILHLWTGVLAASVAAAALGYVLAAWLAPEAVGTVQAFAAGAVLAMLASTMMPEAYEAGGAMVGFVTTIGFLAAFVLSRLEHG